jgi:hypothetical protein
MADAGFLIARPRQRIGWVVLCGLIAAGGALAQPPADSANPQRTIEAEVRQADAASRFNPDKALDRWQALLDRLEADTELPAKRRDALKDMVKDRMRVLRAEADGSAVAQAARLSKTEQRDAEAESARRLFDAVRKLQKEGKLAEAGRQARGVAGRMADSPAAQALQRTTDVADQVAANRAIQQDRARGNTDAMRQADRVGIAPKGDVEFPRDWKARTKDRKSASAVPMTAREKAVLQALDRPISVNFQNSPLSAVIEYLQTLTGQPIVLKPDALEATGTAYNTPVTLRLQDVSLRFVLRKILGDHGLAYIVKDEVIQVVTGQQARETLVTRVHYIGDLLRRQDEFGATLEAAMLIDLIETTIEPSSWKRFGGPGTIIYNHPTRSLVIKQCAEFHGTLSSGLP